MTVAPGAAPVRPGPAPGPSRRGRVLSALAVAGLGAVAVVVAVAGAFVHRWQNPAGILLAVGGAVALGVLARACARSRVGLAVVALLWLVPVLWLGQEPPGDDRVILGDEAGLVFLFGGTTGLALVLGLGAERRDRLDE
ncbi:hypothetical protein E1262_28665 [Jiangella aurantiaca]|uniref:Uncharacterized protein n=1 Tax=Jiangella aurantiaca TaxID=2530373 RepID=A0A4R5A0S9_9ACTN|nr:DUF6113 family protein [Jiangella aurantiaca]TDD64326.1 hypothetical protein E1262_28665 [Jiangella aurantiaca]